MYATNVKLANNVTTMDFTRTCRTCMKLGNDESLINLFGPLKIEDSWSLKLADVLMATTTLQINKEDGLPQNLCDECSKILQIMYTFRNQALNSENELRKLVATNAVIKNEETNCDLKYENELEYLDSYDSFLFDDTPKTEAEKELSIYICNICNKKYIKRKRFLKHLSNHEDTKMVCPLCKKRFHRYSSFEQHMNKHHVSKNVRKLNETLGVNTDTEVEFKVEVENVNEQYKCSECAVIFQNKKLLLEHFRGHKNICVNSDDRVYRCYKCSMSYLKEQKLLEHMIEHSGNLDEIPLEVNIDTNHYKCPECNLVFEKQRSLSSHLKKHKIKVNGKKGTFECDYCDKGFTLKTLLRRHMKLHSEDRPYKCTKCEQSYTRQDQLILHMTKHNGGKRYVCASCDKAFTQLCSLKDHERTHTGETPFLCSQCGKGFNNNSNLRQHLRRHSGLKPFSCNLCPKTFCTKGQMKAHIDTHTGVHPYKCNECGAAFTKPNSLKKHKLIHLGIKPFACDNCNMRFTSKDHLKRHQRIHTGEKPYRCPHCERAFTQSNDLVKHVRTHLGQNIYQCTVCQAKFRLMRELKRHYPIHYINGAEGPPLEGMDQPLVILKECDDQNLDSNEIRPTDRQITITFNSNVLDKNSIGDITINIEPGKISN